MEGKQETMEKEQKPEYLLTDGVKLEPSEDVEEEGKSPVTPSDDSLGALYSEYIQSRTRRTVTAEVRQKPQLRKCSICMEHHPQNLMKLVSVDKVQIVIAAVLHDKFASTDAANQFVKYKNLFVCHSHLIEAHTRVKECLSNVPSIETLLPIFRSLDPLHQFTSDSVMTMMTRFSNSNKFWESEPKSPVSYPPILQVKTSNKTFVRCCICKQSVARQLSKEVTNDEDKIIFASTFRSMFPTDFEVRHFFERPNTYVCHSDILGTNAKIIECCLNRNIIEMELMSTVRIVDPYVTKKIFETMMSNFLARNVDIERNGSSLPTKIVRKTPYGYRLSACRICDSIGSNVLTKLKSMKVLIMIGCVHRGTHTFQQAIPLVRPGNFECCRQHYKETIDIIFYFLSIKTGSELVSCSVESMRNFIKIVHIFSPKMTVRDLQNAINELVAKVDSLKRQDDCSSSEIQSEEKEIKVEPTDRIKEEELFDDEYFERNPPKLESIDEEVDVSASQNNII